MPKTPIDRRPVCKYGSKCFRKNPQHFKDFFHPTASCSATLPTPPLPTGSLTSSRSSTSTVGRKCKFGCGRRVNADARRAYDTCCRKCGVCQGAGEHDETCVGGVRKKETSKPDSALPSEAKALLTVDHALEMRRRAKYFEIEGDTSASASLLADSAEQLEAARAQMPPSSKLASLLDKVIALTRRPGNDLRPVGVLEAEVDTELDRLVAELDEAVSRARAPDTVCGEIVLRARAPDTSVRETAVASKCKFGCGRLANRGFTTCCRACGVCRGAGTHDDKCTGVPAETTTALATICTAIEPAGTPGASSGGSSGGGDGGDGGHAGERSRYGEAPAQGALRTLGLDDAWPTDLTLREIRRRYMREALECHPDKGGADEKVWRTARFQEVADAYATLEAAMAVLERIRNGGDPGVEPSEQGAGSRPDAEQTVEGELLAIAEGIPALPYEVDSDTEETFQQKRSRNQPCAIQPFAACQLGPASKSKKDKCLVQ